MTDEERFEAHLNTKHTPEMDRFARQFPRFESEARGFFAALADERARHAVIVERVRSAFSKLEECVRGRDIAIPIHRVLSLIADTRQAILDETEGA